MICSICKSTNVEVEKKGFSGAKGVVGFALAGPIGGFLGFHKSKSNTYICKNCGKKWDETKITQKPKVGLSFWIILSIVILVLWKINFFGFIFS